MHGEGYKLRPQYAADLIHERAMQWLEQQTPDQPFLGIFTYTLPHAELAQPNDSIVAFYKERFTEDKTWGGDQGSRYNPVDATHTQFAAMITRLDKQVGEILDLLQRRGLADNTIVFFTSDNGPHAEGGADPAFFNAANLLRGIKRTTYEGGIRVPFIAWGPGIVPSGIVSSLPIAFYDMMPTFCDLAGIDDYESRYRNPRADYTDYFDGISIAPTLRGEEGQQLHPHLYWELGEANVLAVRRDHWKLVVRQGNPELYNLANDLHEDHDVKEQYPEILSELIDIVYQEHVDNPLFPITLPPRN
jgi:arylsulfatase